MTSPPDEPDPAAPVAAVPAADLLALVYDELRALARHRMAREGAAHTLEPTALVHEAYARLAKAGDARFANRAHFFHAAATAMRRILIEHARRRGRAKRGGGRARRVPLNVLDLAAAPEPEEIVALDDAVRRLEGASPRAAAVVRLRFYAGLTAEEAAAALGASVRTVHREWTYARAWLYRDLHGGRDECGGTTGTVGG